MLQFKPEQSQKKTYQAITDLFKNNFQNIFTSLSKNTNINLLLNKSWKDVVKSSSYAPKLSDFRESFVNYINLNICKGNCNSFGSKNTESNVNVSLDAEAMIQGEINPILIIKEINTFIYDVFVSYFNQDENEADPENVISTIKNFLDLNYYLSNFKIEANCKNTNYLTFVYEDKKYCISSKDNSLQRGFAFAANNELADNINKFVNDRSTFKYYYPDVMHLQDIILQDSRNGLITPRFSTSTMSPYYSNSMNDLKTHCSGVNSCRYSSSSGRFSSSGRSSERFSSSGKLSFIHSSNGRISNGRTSNGRPSLNENLFMQIPSPKISPKLSKQLPKLSIPETNEEPVQNTPTSTYESSYEKLINKYLSIKTQNKCMKQQTDIDNMINMISYIAYHESESYLTQASFLCWAGSLNSDEIIKALPFYMIMDCVFEQLTMAYSHINEKPSVAKYVSRALNTISKSSCIDDKDKIAYMEIISQHYLQLCQFLTFKKTGNIEEKNKCIKVITGEFTDESIVTKIKTLFEKINENDYVKDYNKPIVKGGSTKQKIFILGKHRNIVLQNRTKYVNYLGELVKLSELKKIEREKRKRGNK